MATQTCQDFEHLVFTDEVGRGCRWGQAWLTELIPAAKGRYIMVLDDDDLMANPNGIALLKEACSDSPRGVIFRANYGDGIVLPTELRFFPKVLWPLSMVGQLCYILRSDIFVKSSYVYRRGLDETDYLCLLDAYDNAKAEDKLAEFVVLDEVINAAQRRDSRGKPE